MHLVSDLSLAEPLWYSFLEITKLIRGAADLQLSVMGDDRNTRRVVATVFQPLYAVENESYDLLGADIPNDSTNSLSSKGEAGHLIPYCQWAHKDSLINVMALLVVNLAATKPTAIPAGAK